MTNTLVNDYDLEFKTYKNEIGTHGSRKDYFLLSLSFIEHGPFIIIIAVS